jgi:DNA-binding transcriptional regulator YiaG
MEKEHFNALLTKAGLSKKEFAAIIGTSQGAMNNWGTSGRDIPYWVESWLTLYIENSECKELKAIIESAVCSKDT